MTAPHSTDSDSHPARPALRAGDIVATAFRLGRAHVGRDAAYVLVTFGVGFALFELAVGIMWRLAQRPDAGLATAVCAMVVLALGVIAGALGMTASHAGLVLGAIETHRGLHPTTHRLYERTRARLRPLFGSLLAKWTLVLLGLACLVVPGVWAGAALSLVVPLVIERGLGVRDAFRTSLDRTRGRRSEIALVYVAIQLTSLVLMRARRPVALSLAPALAAALGTVVDPDTTRFAASLVVYAILGWIHQLLLGYPAAAIYVLLENQRGAVDSAALADTFR